MKKGIAGAVGVVAMIVGGLLVTPVTAEPGQDPLGAILEKLDQLLSAVGNSSAGLQGVTQNWDKALPANDPGGPCPSSSSRFTCVLGGAAVRDNQTGLVWEQAPATERHKWIKDVQPETDAREACLERTTGGQRGWRLPSVVELTSLIDPTQQEPALPAGHPFTNVTTFDTNFWTVTLPPDAPTSLGPYFVTLLRGTIGQISPVLQLKVWCVRGGMNAHQY
jgi:hypothetical protein